MYFVNHASDYSVIFTFTILCNALHISDLSTFLFPEFYYLHVIIIMIILFIITKY